jgi:RNA polymerase sigma factor (sigma-70 family)
VKPLMVAAPGAASDISDSQLVDAAREGSDTAFESLFCRYRDRITAYVRSIVSDHARAEDIVQDVFMSALRSLRSSDRGIAFKPWIYEIAKNACIDHIRKARRASEVSIDSEDFSPVDEGRMSAGVATTDAAYAAREDLDALRMAFNDLPDAQREVLVSRELEGLSYDSISNRTGLSRSAVESMLFRARRTLKDGYDDIATGERCERMQTVMVHLTDGRIGLRQERRLVRHLQDCAACRREAIALGLDELVVGAPSRTKAALARVAVFLPLPAFLRRRFFDAAGLVGSAPGGPAEQGMSLAAKAGVVLAAAAIAGGGVAGVAHQTGAPGKGGGGNAAAPAGQQSSPAAGSSAGGSSTGGHGNGVARPGKAVGGGNGGGAHTSAPAGRAGAGSPGEPLGGAGSGAGGAGGKGAAVGGNLNGTVAGGATRAGGAVGGAVNGVGGTVDSVGGTVGGTLGGPVTGVGGTVDSTVKGVAPTVDNTVKGVTGTVNGVTGALTQPTTPQSPVPLVQKKLGL